MDDLVFYSNLFIYLKENLILSSNLIRNGILFIWSEKYLIWDICKILAKKGFLYIENFAVIFLSMQKCLK